MYKVPPRWWSKALEKNRHTKAAALLHRPHTAVTVHVHRKGNPERNLTTTATQSANKAL